MEVFRPINTEVAIVLTVHCFLIFLNSGRCSALSEFVLKKTNSQFCTLPGGRHIFYLILWSCKPHLIVLYSTVYGNDNRNMFYSNVFFK